MPLFVSLVLLRDSFPAIFDYTRNSSDIRHSNGNRDNCSPRFTKFRRHRQADGYDGVAVPTRFSTLL